VKGFKWVKLEPEEAKAPVTLIRIVRSILKGVRSIFWPSQIHKECIYLDI
jgi:hypothetical protein